MSDILQKKGFTLVETLVAITILTLAIVGPLYTANRAIVAAQSARDQLVASYLAQEGVEYMRALRDDAFLFWYPGDTTGAWNGFLAASASCRPIGSDPGRACAFDPVGVSGNPSLSSCSTSSCPRLYLASNGAAKYYTTNPNAGGAAITPFMRTIQVITVSPVDERIVSKVTWNFHNTPYSVTVTDHLTPWQ